MLQQMNSRLATQEAQVLDLAAFEKSVRRYEQESGKTLDEEMLQGMVLDKRAQRLQHTERYP